VKVKYFKKNNLAHFFENRRLNKELSGTNLERMKSNIEVTKLGLIYNPPTLIVEYNSKLDSPKSKELHHRKIRFKTEIFNNDDISSDDIAAAISSDLPEYFEAKHVSFSQLSKIIEKLITVYKRQDGKFIMKKDCSEESLSSSNKDNHSKREELSCKTKTSQSHKHNLIDDLIPFGNLNKVSEKDLSKAKEKMNVAFNSNKILPGDEGYQYDKRVNFEVESECSWD
jgi:hypothetical protein